MSLPAIESGAESVSPHLHLKAIGTGSSGNYTLQPFLLVLVLVLVVGRFSYNQRPRTTTRTRTRTTTSTITL
jgi:hypothetical protein